MEDDVEIIAISEENLISNITKNVKSIQEQMNDLVEKRPKLNEPKNLKLSPSVVIGKPTKFGDFNQQLLRISSQQEGETKLRFKIIEKSFTKKPFYSMPQQFTVLDTCNTPVVKEELDLQDMLKLIIRYQNEDLTYNESNGYFINHCYMLILDDRFVELARIELFGFNADANISFEISEDNETVAMKNNSSSDYFVKTEYNMFPLLSNNSLQLPKQQVQLLYGIMHRIIVESMYSEVFGQYLEEIQQQMDTCAIDVNLSKLQ